MNQVLLAFALLSPAPARASAPQGAPAAFAAAYGAAAYAVVSQPSLGRVIVRRLGLDGGVLWEQEYGKGRHEIPVGAAVTTWGGVSVAGDDDGGCFAAHWASNGTQRWENYLQAGAECHVRAALVDAQGDTYVLATTTVDGTFGPSVWKIDKAGAVLWSYSPGGEPSRYAFALNLDADDGVSIATAVSRTSGWEYASVDLDANGRARWTGASSFAR